MEQQKGERQMAEQQVHDFMDKVKSDENLRSKLEKMPAGQDSIKYVIDLGKEAGYDFNERDLEAATKSKLSSGEISQEDLDKVSGGTGILTITVIATGGVVRIFTATVC